MANLSKWVTGLAGAAILVGGGYWGYQKYQESQSPAAVSADGKDAADGKKGKGAKGGAAGAAAGRNTPAPVAVAQAREGNVNVYLNGLGTVTPLRTVTVHTRVDGELVRIHFREGQAVKQGDVLAEIDPRPYQAQLLQAQGQMQRDQALLANARVDLDRYRTLLKQDSIAEQQVATQESLVRQLEGTVKLDQGNVDNARLQVVYARVTSPIAGVVGLRQVDQGNVVHAGDTNGLVVITQLTPISVIYTIPQDNLPQVLARLRSGEAVPVEVYDRDQKAKLGAGRLMTADNQIDVTTGTVKLRAQLNNDDNTLFPNQFVNVRMLVDTRDNVITVPSSALQRGAQGIFVYVLQDDSTVQMRPVKTGPVDGTRIVVETGVKVGERVVTDGMDRLRDGMRVEVADRTAKAGNAKGGRRGKGGKGKGADKSGDASGDAAADKAGDKGGDKASDKGPATPAVGPSPESKPDAKADTKADTKADANATGNRSDRAKGGNAADIARDAATEGIRTDGSKADASKDGSERRHKGEGRKKKAQDSQDKDKE